jgi:hypothetical protein
MNLLPSRKFLIKVAGILAATSITNLFAINAGATPIEPTLAIVVPSAEIHTPNTKSVETTAKPAPTETSVVKTDTEVKVAPTLPKRDWQQARIDYKSARKMLAKGDFAAYRTLRKKLTDYPLYPYLEYQYLRQHLTKSNTRQIKQFINTWSDTPLAAPLKHRWLKKLAKSGQWQHYLDNYDGKIKSTELQCYAL